MPKIKSYHGNKNLKPIGYEHEFTQHQIQEIIKCQNDVVYFVEKYVKIISLDKGLIPFRLYKCQRDEIKQMIDERMLIVMQPRQVGKTVTASAAILWYSLFNTEKVVAILAHKGAGARNVLQVYQLMYENLPIWLQQGVKTWNKGDVELENGTIIFTSATTASGIRGRSVNWLYIDEAAMIPNTVAEEFFASTYPVISAGKTTKILITSTPLGYNHFWKFWNEAEHEGKPSRNGFKTLFIPYTEIPGRDKAWAEEQLKRLGEVKFNQEVLCQFLGSANTLINGLALSRLSSTTPIYEKNRLAVYKNPIKNHSYVLTVDTAEGIEGDASAFAVIDTTQLPYELVARFKDHKIRPLLFPTYIHQVAKQYNEAWVLVETIDIGRQVADILHDYLEYENVLYTNTETGKTQISAGFGTTQQIGLKQNKATKRIGCMAIKMLVEEEKLQIFDADVISEMATFVQTGTTYKADEGYFDDLMMCLVMFGWVTTSPYFKDLTNVDIRKQMYEGQDREVEEELTPFAIIDDGLFDDTKVTIDDKGDLWLSVSEDPMALTDPESFKNYYSFG